MGKYARAIFDIVLYIAIVGVIVWGIPKGLAYWLKTDSPLAAITSGSMWPELKRGDLVLIESVPRESLRSGDIVVWKNDSGFTIHRIESLNDTTIVTKGDANFRADEPVPYEDVVGRTVAFRDGPFRVPYLGLISIYGTNYIAKRNAR